MAERSCFPMKNQAEAVGLILSWILGEFEKQHGFRTVVLPPYSRVCVLNGATGYITGVQWR